MLLHIWIEQFQRLAVEMPISEGVDTVLHCGGSIDLMIEQLLRRPYKSE